MSQQKIARNHLTGKELNVLIEMIGGSRVVKQILSKEYAIRVRKIRPTLANLLQEIGSQTELPFIKRFVARKNFVLTRFAIEHLNPNFKENFMDVEEKDVGAVSLKQRKLLKRSDSVSILAALGDKDLAKIKKAKIALVHALEFLKSADRCKRFIFYIADAKGIIWTVIARWWNEFGWRIEAHAITDSIKWNIGYRVVSP